jgi:hypothetical protein
VRLQSNSSGKASRVAKKIKVEGYAVVAEEIRGRATYGNLMDTVVKTAEKNTDAMKVHKPGGLVADTDIYIISFGFCFHAKVCELCTKAERKPVGGRHPLIIVPYLGGNTKFQPSIIVQLS